MKMEEAIDPSEYIMKMEEVKDSSKYTEIVVGIKNGCGRQAIRDIHCKYKDIERENICIGQGDDGRIRRFLPFDIVRKVHTGHLNNEWMLMEIIRLCCGNGGDKKNVALKKVIKDLNAKIEILENEKRDFKAQIDSRDKENADLKMTIASHSETENEKKYANLEAECKAKIDKYENDRKTMADEIEILQIDIECERGKNIQTTTALEKEKKLLKSREQLLRKHGISLPYQDNGGADGTELEIQGVSYN